MGIVRKVVVTIVGLLVALVLLQFVASESGEVVVVSALDEEGAPQETRLWVVDLNGFQYLRAGDPNSGWFARIRANGRIGMARGDHRAAYDAYPEVAVRTEVNDLMREKYGWADQLIALMFGRDDATPIRLEIYHEVPPAPETSEPEA